MIFLFLLLFLGVLFILFVFCDIQYHNDKKKVFAEKIRQKYPDIDNKKIDILYEEEEFREFREIHGYPCLDEKKKRLKQSEQNLKAYEDSIAKRSTFDWLCVAAANCKNKDTQKRLVELAEFEKNRKS